jgi:flagellar L-ring protein precursor FlgH
MPRKAILLALLAAVAIPAAGQQRDSTAARRDSDAIPVLRSSWLSDRRPLSAGDLITVVVDERTSASERTATTASGKRAQTNGAGASVKGAVEVGPYQGSFSTEMSRNSRDQGEHQRSRDLVGIITVRVTEVLDGGVVRIQGKRSVIVDGRPQDLTLSGLVRTADIGIDNVVLSSRIAEATILFRGKKIGPSSGLAGKLLGLFWP